MNLFFEKSNASSASQSTRCSLIWPIDGAHCPFIGHLTGRSHPPYDGRDVESFSICTVRRSTHFIHFLNQPALDIGRSNVKEASSGLQPLLVNRRSPMSGQIFFFCTLYDGNTTVIYRFVQFACQRNESTTLLRWQVQNWVGTLLWTRLLCKSARIELGLVAVVLLVSFRVTWIIQLEWLIGQWLQVGHRPLGRSGGRHRPHNDVDEPASMLPTPSGSSATIHRQIHLQDRNPTHFGRAKFQSNCHCSGRYRRHLRTHRPHWTVRYEPQIRSDQVIFKLAPIDLQHQATPRASYF